MRTAQSDRILALVESSIKVESEIETHKEEVADRLHEDFVPIFAAWEEGQPKPDFRATLRALKDKLGDSREKLVAAEERHIDLVKQAVELRGEREELTGSLYEDLSSMRRTVEELYRDKGNAKGNANASAFVVAGIQGPTAWKPTKLLRQVDLATRHLRQPGLVFPASRFGGTRLQPLNLARVLEPRATRLHEVQDGLQRVASQMNASRKEKKRAFESHQKTFSWVAGAAESLFHLAGEHELADRVRPSTRRPGRRAAEDAKGEEGESASGASPDDGVPAEDSVTAEAGDGGTGDSPTASPEVATASETDPASTSDG